MIFLVYLFITLNLEMLEPLYHFPARMKHACPGPKWLEV